MYTCNIYIYIYIYILIITFFFVLICGTAFKIKCFACFVLSFLSLVRFLFLLNLETFIFRKFLAVQFFNDLTNT